jgi:GH24 family phage-related lysozyme (muramidase)
MKENQYYIGIYLFVILMSICMFLDTKKPEKVNTIIPAKIVTEKDKLIAVIKRYEKFRSVREKENGKYYIGYGHQCLNDEFTEPIDSAMADCIVREDLDFYIKTTRWLNLTENQRLAVASFCFNFGYSYFINSTLYKLIKNNKPVSIEWLKHRNFKGNSNEGLSERRAYEVYLYCF